MKFLTQHIDPKPYKPKSTAERKRKQKAKENIDEESKEINEEKLW